MLIMDDELNSVEVCFGVNSQRRCCCLALDVSMAIMIRQRTIDLLIKSQNSSRSENVLIVLLIGVV